MATLDDIQRILAKLPGVSTGEFGYGYSVLIKGKEKGFAWTWNERVEPKKPKVPNPEVLAIWVPNLAVKELLEAAGPPKFVHDPHYDNYPAVLVRFAEMDAEELADLLIEAWRCKAPKRLIAEYDAAQPESGLT